MEIIDLWDSYSLKFNELSDKLAAAGIKNKQSYGSIIGLSQTNYTLIVVNHAL